MRLKTKKQFIEAIKHVKKMKNNILIVIVIFLLSSIVGFLNADKLGFLDSYLSSLISRTEGMNLLELIFFILQNNLQSAFFGMVFGIVLGIYPILAAMINGSVVGYVYEKVAQVAGYGEIWRLVPHGIFELPAIFISLAMGLDLGGFIFAKNKKKEFAERLYRALNAFLFIVVPLLIIAAFIEGILIVIYK